MDFFCLFVGLIFWTVFFFFLVLAGLNVDCRTSSSSKNPVSSWYYVMDFPFWVIFQKQSQCNNNDVDTWLMWLNSEWLRALYNTTHCVLHDRIEIPCQRRNQCFFVNFLQWFYFCLVYLLCNFLISFTFIWLEIINWLLRAREKFALFQAC